LNQLRAEGYPVKEEDAYRLSPLRHESINMLGAIHFRCRRQWPKENCVHCVIQRMPTHENPYLGFPFYCASNPIIENP